ncbi:MAG: hypothetical protein CMJ93_03070 [Planctomycetes bacterium]|nr:hypothetical protein [Planctomycetota bacterium]
MSKQLAQTIETLNNTKSHLITPAARQAQIQQPRSFLPIAYRLCLGIVYGLGLGVGWLFIQTVQSWVRVWLT